MRPPAFPYRALARPLAPAARASAARTLNGLLGFQRKLARWPLLRKTLPDAAPFVSLYARGALRGCFGDDDGAPGERLGRAFLRAMHDSRFGGVTARERTMVEAQVSYPCAPRLVTPATFEQEVELGTHGVVLARDGAPPTLLLPSVARHDGLGARELLLALRRKAGVADDDESGRLWVFATEEIVTSDRAKTALKRADRLSLALDWMASLVGPDGRVAFSVDARARTRSEVGLMSHARASVAIQALAAGGKHPRHVARARRWLARAITDGLDGRIAAGFPSEPAPLAGTLALACLAGIDLRGELAALARERRHEIAAIPWHAAQVAVVMPDAPVALWEACVADLEPHPWAPWTVMAAAARNDHAVHDRAARAVADGLRVTAPYLGGASFTLVPEVALTALAVEALATHPAPWARAAVDRGRAFLEATQLVGPRVYAALDPSLANGAFPISPVVDVLRADVTGHAVLALAGVPAARATPSFANPVR